MNIGIDFDGVIVDSIKLKQRLFKQELGIDVKPEECSRERLEGKVSEEDYIRIVEGMIYGSELCLQMEEVEGARAVIQRLREDGHRVYVITSRYGKQAKYARKLMELRGIVYDGFVNTGRKPKKDACKENNIAVLVEDSHKKLVVARNSGMRLMLLTRPYNADIRVDDDVERAESWQKLYGTLS